MSFSEWKKLKLGEISTKITKGTTPTSLGFPFVDKGINFIKVEALTFDGTIDYLKFSFISEEANVKLKRSIIEEGDILFSMAGMVLGKTAVVKKEHLPANTNQALAIIRLNQAVALPRFVEYFMRQSSFFNYVNSSTGQSAQPNINLEEIGNLVINLPPKETQQRIASILCSLDDKIELNRQTNKTLETIAQTLFKEMCLPKGEELPEGWEVVKLAEIMKIKHGYAFKGEFFSDEETNDILVTPGNFKIGGGFNYSKFKYYKGEVPNDYILKENDLIVTMTDLSKEGDTLGYAALIPTIEGKKLLHNQRVGKVEFKENNSLKYFLYFVMRENNYRNFVLSGATGTTVRHTSPDRICDFTVTLPNQNILEDFSEIVHPVFDNIQLLEREIQTLSSLRDSLLPKLMKGEINV